MAKRRYQNPKPFREGNWWWINPWTDEFQDGHLTRKRKRMKVCEASTSAPEAKRIASEMMRPMNQGLESIGAATPFAVYVNSTYRDAILPRLGATTQPVYEYVLDKHLMPVFGELPLRDLTPITLQKYFSRLEGSYASANKIRTVLASVLSSAVFPSRLLVTNPLEGIGTKQTPEDKDKPTITMQQFDALVNVMLEPYASMIYVCVLAGLRPSELIALKWGDVGNDSLRIDERYCRGNCGKPKTKASKATIAVDASVIHRIQRLKQLEISIGSGKKKKLVRSAEPDDLVFQSVRAGKPMDDHNILARHLKPAARKLGIAGCNWQCLRRSYATWMVDSGADIKSVQAQMRHSRITTTLEVYAQTVPASQRAAVTRLSGVLEQARAISAAVN